MTNVTPFRTTVEELQPEGTTRTVTITLDRGTAASPIEPAAMVSITLTLTHRLDGSVVNGRIGVDVFDANGGSYAAGGILTMEFSPADMAILGGRPREARTALFLFVYDASRTGWHEVRFTVANQATIT